jgi:hypothetical protein
VIREPTSTASAKAKERAVRESKDHVAIETLALCRDLHIRAMVGGGPVLTAHGLMSPSISHNASIVVDPASIRHLHSVLRERGWRDVKARQGAQILPPARLRLTHDDELSGLMLYSVIPGFFADPGATFDLIWERQMEIPLRGVMVRALGRVSSAILASHDGLDGRASRQRSNFDYFVQQFRLLLTERERPIVVDLIRKVGGCAEMSALLEALDVEPCAFTLPSIPYVQWRLQVTEVSDQTRRALAFLELAPHGRQMMYRSKTGRPRSLGDVWTSATSLPATVNAIFGARRRWADSLREVVA